MDIAPVLLLAAHGTRSDAGRASIERIVDAVRAERPGLDVALCYLDVLEPSLATYLDAAGSSRATTVVPALLSTGYHVRRDIPEAVAGRPEVLVARHLGPHPLLIDALLDRLAQAGGNGDGPVALAAAGSSDPAAEAEVAVVARALAERSGRPTTAISLTDTVAFAAGIDVATYLLAEGAFADRERRLADAAGARSVSAPLAGHPAVVRLILHRYDETRKHQQTL
ncbi:MAG TPA: CbiX/SirB N-terminal domain-containing protein [Jatrophihabitantaceae bacterium]|jgi:sirohydrochlorin ferrochelatase|nr:CbiX/SirB N-terminal domain-containing protein [Jatrophihabitantaceae bacterium]